MVMMGIHPAYGLYEAQLRRVISGGGRRKVLVIYGGGCGKESREASVNFRSRMAGAKYRSSTAVDGDLACFDWNGADGDGPANNRNQASCCDMSVGI
jgi:hypothetical protein